MAKYVFNGQQTFFDANGDPLSGGKVYMYIPATTTAKNTWQEADETTLNVNPIILDIAGRATIYGTGSYRQLVTDADDVTVWDKVVTLTETSEQLWGDTSTGSANNQSVELANGDLLIVSTLPVGGQVVSFMAGYTNTGPAQLTVTWPASESYGPTQISKNTDIGPAPLEGGEIVVGNLVTVIYDDASGQWMIQNPVSVKTRIIPIAYSIDEPYSGLIAAVSLIQSYELDEAAAGCYAYAEVPSTGDYEITIKKNTVTVGTVTFTSASNTGTIALTTDVSITPGDRLVLICPVSVDATIAGISVTFKTTRVVKD